MKKIVGIVAAGAILATVSTALILKKKKEILSPINLRVFRITKLWQIPPKICIKKLTFTIIR